MYGTNYINDTDFNSDEEKYLGVLKGLQICHFIETCLKV